MSKSDNRVRLTAKAIKEITNPSPGEGGKLARTYLYDAEILGLAFCAASTGRRFFCFCRVVPSGDFKRITIGDASSMTIDQARKRAAALNNEIAGGVDPVARKREVRRAAEEAKLAAKNAPTVGKLWTMYHDEFLKKGVGRQKGPAKPKTIEEFERLHDSYLAEFDDYPLTHFTPEVCEALRTKVTSVGRITANRLMELVGGMFRACGKHFGLPKRFSPESDIQPYQEKPRTRVLSDDERLLLAQSLADEPQVITRDYFAMLCFTGQRRRNVAAMRWVDIKKDGAMSVWVVPGHQSKNGDDLIIPLTPQACEIIDRRRGEVPKGCVFVFPAVRPISSQVKEARSLRDQRKTTRQIGEAVGLSQTSVMRVLDPEYEALPETCFQGVSKAWKRIRERAGIVGARPHDLRRTFITAIGEAGVDIQHVSTAVGHKSLQTTERVYLQMRQRTANQAVLEGFERDRARLEQLRAAKKPLEISLAMTVGLATISADH